MSEGPVIVVLAGAVLIITIILGYWIFMNSSAKHEAQRKEMAARKAELAMRGWEYLLTPKPTAPGTENNGNSDNGNGDSTEMGIYAPILVWPPQQSYFTDPLSSNGQQQQLSALGPENAMIRDRWVVEESTRRAIIALQVSGQFVYTGGVDSPTAAAESIAAAVAEATMATNSAQGAWSTLSSSPGSTSSTATVVQARSPHTTIPGLTSHGLPPVVFRPGSVIEREEEPMEAVIVVVEHNDDAGVPRHGIRTRQREASGQEEEQDDGRTLADTEGSNTSLEMMHSDADAPPGYTTSVVVPA